MLDGRKVLFVFRDPALFHFDEAENDIWIDFEAGDYKKSGLQCIPDVPTGTIWSYFQHTSCSLSSKKYSSEYKTFSIIKTSLTSIPQHIFYQLNNLEAFDMTQQNLRVLYIMNFQFADQLKHLNLSKNSLTRIAVDDFSLLPNLESIDLSANKIQHISNFAFSKLNNIKVLILSNNQLVIGESQWIVPSVIYVDLDNNNMRLLIGTLITPKLETLLLNNNNFTNLPSLNSSLHVLKRLEVSNNPLYLRELTTEVNYEVMDISETKIELCAISPEAKVLYASRNNITNLVGAGVGNVEYSLVELYVAHNAFVSMESLQIFINLKVVDLSFNLIAELHSNTVFALTHLESLNLSQNKIVSIDYSSFWELCGANLKFLDLSYNGVTNFELKTTAPKLEALHIEGLQLTEMSTNIKLFAPHLQRIGMNDNKFDCEYLEEIVMQLSLDGVSFVPHLTQPNFIDNVHGVQCLNISRSKDVNKTGEILRN